MGPKREKSTNANVYQLKVTLKRIRPPIWRRIQVTGDTTLIDLHHVLQGTMGWFGGHLHQFIIGHEYYSEPDPWGGMDAIDEREIRLDQIAPEEKFKFIYEYDFGDGWEHEILVEKILPADPDQDYPSCLKGKRACPPEDCGGPWGYAEMLEALGDPEHPEREMWVDWIGEDFDSEEFDLDLVNSILK